MPEELQVERLPNFSGNKAATGGQWGVTKQGWRHLPLNNNNNPETTEDEAICGVPEH